MDTMTLPRAASAATILALASTPCTAGAAPATGPVSGNQLNPAISLILDGKYAVYDIDPETYEIPGFQLGGEAGLASEGFSMGHSELNISSNVDDKFYGYMTIAIVEEGGATEVELEEAYLETLALPEGFTIKAGKFLSHVGYQNVRHAHTWDFVDSSLPYRAFLGEGFKDTGMQLRWLPPTPVYTEFGVELFRGDAFPGAGAEGSGAGVWSSYFKLGGDVGTSNSWQAGLSYLSADAEGRAGGHGHGEEEAGHDGLAPAFTGDSDLLIADLVWKWSPRGNVREKNFVFAAEYMRRDEDGAVAVETDTGHETGSYVGDQDGFYLSGVYQFMPRWRVGLRYGRLSADNTVLGLSEETVLDEDGHDPSRWSAMLDFSNSEYSRIRLQFNRDRSGPDTDNQVFLQYILSLGPHGAHRF